MKVIVLIFIVFCTSCSSLVYQPSKATLGDPLREYNYSYKEVNFNFKNEKKYYWHISGSENRNKILFVQLHGNSQNMSTHFKVLTPLLDEGADLLTYDYSGYGKSEGKPNQKQLVQESRYFIDLILNEYSKKYNRIVLIGQSLGGNILLKVLEIKGKDERISSVIIDSSFISYKELAFYKLSSNVFTALISPMAYLLVEDIGAPLVEKISPSYNVIVLHATNDPVVPLSFGQDIYSRLQTRKTLITYRSDTHILSFLSPTVRKRISKAL